MGLKVRYVKNVLSSGPRTVESVCRPHATGVSHSCKNNVSMTGKNVRCIPSSLTVVICFETGNADLMFVAALPSLDFTGIDMDVLELQNFRPLKVMGKRLLSFNSGPKNDCLTLDNLEPQSAQHMVVLNSGTSTTLK